MRVVAAGDRERFPKYLSFSFVLVLQESILFSQLTNFNFDDDDWYLDRPYAFNEVVDVHDDVIVKLDNFLLLYLCQGLAQ